MSPRCYHAPVLLPASLPLSDARREPNSPGSRRRGEELVACSFLAIGSVPSLKAAVPGADGWSIVVAEL